jgi:hypothetical protein
VQDAVWLVLIRFNDLCEISKPVEGVQGVRVLKTGVCGGKGGFRGKSFGVRAVVSQI